MLDIRVRISNPNGSKSSYSGKASRVSRVESSAVRLVFKVISRACLLEISLAMLFKNASPLLSECIGLFCIKTASHRSNHDLDLHFHLHLHLHPALDLDSSSSSRCQLADCMMFIACANASALLHPLAFLPVLSLLPHLSSIVFSTFASFLSFSFSPSCLPSPL